MTVTLLRRLGLQLINIHGQHDSQRLFDEANHLIYLDAFAHDEALLEAYGAAFSKAQELRREIDRLDMDEAEKARLVETLEYQIGEIERAELRPGEDEELRRGGSCCKNAEKLSGRAGSRRAALYGDEDSDGAGGRWLARQEKALSRVKSVSDDVAALHQKVTELVYAAQDAAEEARDVRDELTYSAEELEQIEQRLDVLHKLKRKYGASVEDVLVFLEQARSQLDEIEFASDKMRAAAGAAGQAGCGSTAGRACAARSAQAGPPWSWSSGSRRSFHSWTCRRCSSSVNLRSRSRRKRGWTLCGS